MGGTGAGLHLAPSSGHLSPPLLDGVRGRGVPRHVLVVGLLGDVAQTKWWGRVVLPVLHGFRREEGGVVDPRVEGGIDGELPLQLAVLRGRGLLELTPGPGSWRLKSVAGETAHLQTWVRSPAGLLWVQDGAGAGHARHPQLSLLQPGRVLH